MNLDILKTHSAFQQQLRASAGGCARNRPAAEERADATVGERQEPQGFGMPRALRDLIPREANVIPSPGRWANPVGSNRPLCLPSHWGLWGASRASDGLCWEDWGSGWANLVPVPPPPPRGSSPHSQQLRPLSRTRSRRLGVPWEQPGTCCCWLEIQT